MFKNERRKNRKTSRMDKKNGKWDRHEIKKSQLRRPSCSSGLLSSQGCYAQLVSLKFNLPKLCFQISSQFSLSEESKSIQYGYNKCGTLPKHSSMGPVRMRKKQRKKVRGDAWIGKKYSRQESICPDDQLQLGPNVPQGSVLLGFSERIT